MSHMICQMWRESSEAAVTEKCLFHRKSGSMLRKGFKIEINSYGIKVA